MTTLLSDMHLPMLIQTTLSESPYKSVPWNNLDQLSCLWGVFTKCKNNIRDGEKSLHRTKSLPDLSQWSHQKKSFKRPSQKFFITEEEPMEEVSLTFTKITTNALSKPVSLLSDMLVENNSGLRRCQSRYSRLDQFFLEATTA
ncbi:uncharacterized protein EV154DRAFT_414828 [Mucor mucedo]|uniref:uncharacterized protein n=1 Tax=Mucor mucedo TaxID=29922 RepID=UPI00221ED781|nr:uncharacterized protein EV154DRAFT_414828 [Mucor mucedo]KAI7894612.1 hypothetical protein EV154DRAFT_414828 [Mucor mucedo]